MKITEKLFQSLLSYSPPIWATAVGGVSVVVTLFLSMFLLFQHLSAYKNPEVARLLLFLLLFNMCLEYLLSCNLIVVWPTFLQEQKFLIGVILMVPCYAIESVRSLVTGA